jgi:DNA polymerase III subunit delta
MKIETRSLAGFLKRPDPGCQAILLYGEDAGLVRERGEALARTVVDDLADPFRVADIAGEILAEDPARLADEAAAMSLMGGRRVVRVRHVTPTVGKDIAESFASFLRHGTAGHRPQDLALIVVEAGELDGRSPLRKLFEAAPNAGAIACYRDEGESLSAVIRETLGRHDVRVSGDALAWLASRLGGDRAVTRGELEKLALYVGAGHEATLEDVRAVVGDSADIDFDDLANATALGDVPGLGRAFDKLAAEGLPPVPILRAVQRHFTRLHLCAGLVAAGQDPETAMMRLRPPVFWKNKDAFRAQLRRWPADRLSQCLERLLDAEIACKTTGQAAETLAGRCLFELAQAATNNDRR